MAAIRPGIDGPGAFNPSTITNLVSRVRADDLAGADGAAITTWAQTAGTAPSATGTGTLKTGVNGINSKNVVRFNGSSDKFTMTTGGASLTGDWYVAAVCKFAVGNVYQNVMSWGDQLTQKRRSMMRLSSADGTNPNAFAFVENSPTNLAATALSTATAYLLEMQFTGGLITLWINGIQVTSSAPTATLLAYAATAIVLGVNPAGGEFLNGDIAEIITLGAAISAANRAQLQAYFNAQYGLGINQLPYARFTSLNASLASGLLSEDTTTVYGPAAAFTGVVQSGSLLVNQATQLSVGGNNAVASFSGIVAAKSPTFEHQFILNPPSQTGQYDANVMAIQHLYTGGVSGIRFRDDGSAERMAVGYGNSGLSGPAPAFAGRAFVEVSNIPSGGSATTPGAFAIVQSGTVNGLSNNNYMRYELKGDGSQHWYNLAAPASVVDWFSIDNLGNVIVGNAALATNATDGFLYIPTCAGTPTGTPTAKTGRAPMIYDTTNHKFWIYDAGWKGAVLS